VGSRSPPAALDLPPLLGRRLIAWNARYQDAYLPIEGPGNEPYLDEGRNLLNEVREALHPEHLVIVTEPWWGEPPADTARSATDG
jgi:hypothetical protein